jgi:prepilin-type N-terminal cleavage/methylation domain-containing protein
MCIKDQRNRAFTLVEVMVATALSVLVVAVVLSLSFFSSRSFVAMTSYTDLGLASQLALDKFSREVRQAHSVTDCRSNSLTFLDGNTNAVTFAYNPEARTLSRIGAGQTNLYLGECDSLRFAMYQHTVISNTFNCYDPAFVTNAKVVQVTWSCSRQTPGVPVKGDNAQSMKIALRNH